MSLRLVWRRTWDDRPQDFICFAPGLDESVGRIYSTLKPGTLVKQWRWAANGYIPDRRMWLSQGGFADTKMEAAKAVEEVYFRVMGEKCASQE
ncbi:MULTISPECIES: hypothetical protein [Chelativorans]|uniref:Uncharacterized protein n=1 Tax=Chelativorans sp. (strain BNC1) TaxID=266779 RepID=Q11LS2_CHESB|nr:MULTISPECIES: hypothetical protein [Chelativorans]